MIMEKNQHSGCTNSLYAAWKQDLLQRVAEADVRCPPSRCAKPPCSRLSPRSVSPRVRSARPQSAHWRGGAQVVSSTVVSPPPRPPVRPYSASTAGRFSGRPIPRRSELGMTRGMPAPCFVLIDVDRLFKEGKFGCCRAELRRAGLEGLPRCCNLHKLLIARLELVSKHPGKALSMYEALPQGTIPDGEWNAANGTAAAFSTATRSRQVDHLNALVDAFSGAAPSVAAHFLIQRVASCLADDNLDEALSGASRAVRLCPSSCEAATCCWLLNFALDEKATIESLPPPPNASACADHTHVFCRGMATAMRYLTEFFKKARFTTATGLAPVVHGITVACEAAEALVPPSLIRAVLLRVEHAMVSLGRPTNGKVTLSSDSDTHWRNQFIARREANLLLESLLPTPAKAFRFLNENISLFPQRQSDDWQKRIAVRFVQNCCNSDMPMNSSDVFGLLGCASDKSVDLLKRRKRQLSLALHPDKWASDGDSAEVAKYCFRWMCEEYDRLRLHL